MRLTASSLFFSRRSTKTIIISALLALAGCAGSGASKQNATSVHINPTLEDAQRQTRGTATSRAPSQLQLGFGEGVQKQQATPEGATVEQQETTLHPLTEPKTFLGTIPCQNDLCSASRISLTLAPAGQWRARITPLGSTQQASAEQGCWNVVSQNPTRIILLQNNDAILANLGFINDNVLRVNQIHGNQPRLEYRLTRQAEIDAIDELHGQALPACSPN